ncbi:MAG: energy-dependent translational throttle protein EttA [Myxococcales bacterium]|nr:energy-dependent translational throttle protein EttA [Myxococcales bacterium]
MAEYIYTLQDVSKVHPPDKKILTDVYLSFLPGAKIGVLGANGAGKSSVLRIMAGADKSFNGEAWAKPGASVSYLPQEPTLTEGATVRECVDEAVAETRALLSRFEELSMKLGESLSDDEMNKVIDAHGQVQDAIEACDGWSLDHTLEVAMDALRLPPPDAVVDVLSGGERRRVALCQVLLRRADLLLLDEPTNHLDAESVAWLEQHLDQYPGCVVAVTHDRYFLDNVAEWILELDRGRALPFKGNYSAWLEHKRERLHQEEKQESARQRKIKHELEWVQSAQKARQAKGKARLNRYQELLNRAGRDKRDLNEIFIPAGPRLGDLVIEARGLRMAFGDKLLFEGLDFSLPKGGLMGIVGPNGAGKTTLFRLLVGQEQPEAGELTIGDTVRIAYVDQSRDALDGDKTVWDEIAEGRDSVDVGKQSVASRAYVSLFNFRGSDQQKLVKNLSGGERNRVHLAKLLKSGGNVLLLDEPTNDLDVETLRSLEEALLEFAGCAIVISHDRWFLDRICTHILAFEGDSQVVFFEGSYQDYEADRKRRLGDAAERPHRIKYRHLT